MAQGDRLNLAHIACKCDVTEARDVDTSDFNRQRARTEPPSKRARGFEADLDPMGQGIYETYTRKCARDGVAECTHA